MCLILIACGIVRDRPLVILANRDEFYARPSAPVAFRPELPGVLAGRDLQDGGAWLGVTRTGRFAAVTNYRDPRNLRSGVPSRGGLVCDFLRSDCRPEDYRETLRREGHRYNGFNLVFGTLDALSYTSNRGAGAVLSPGLYGLSNALLETPWPKVRRIKELFAAAENGTTGSAVERWFAILRDELRPDVETLPDTGVGREWESILSPLFIRSAVYGTRSSTVLWWDRDGAVHLEERVYDARPDPWVTSRACFRLRPPEDL